MLKAEVYHPYNVSGKRLHYFKTLSHGPKKILDNWNSAELKRIFLFPSADFCCYVIKTEMSRDVFSKWAIEVKDQTGFKYQKVMWGQTLSLMEGSWYLKWLEMGCWPQLFSFCPPPLIIATPVTGDIKNSHDKSFMLPTVSHFNRETREKNKTERQKDRLRGMEKERERVREREAFKRILSVIDWLHSSANSHLKIMGLLVEIKASIVCLIAFWQMGADTTTCSIPPGTLAEHRPSISRSPIELALITGHELLIHVPYWRQRAKRKKQGRIAGRLQHMIGVQVPVEGKRSVQKSPRAAISRNREDIPITGTGR